MAEPFIGEVRMFAGTFAPRNYAFASGQTLSIAQNTALFSLYGTTYGGNGTTTFMLPNLQATAPMHRGQGPGLTDRPLGAAGGSPSVTLLAAEMAAHTHAYSAENANAVSTDPANDFVAANRNLTPFTPPGASGLQVQPMSPQALGSAGGSLPHNNLQPFLGINFIVALQGIFPARN